MKTFLKGLLVMAILGAGLATMFALKSMKNEPEKKEPGDNSVVVVVEPARLISKRVSVSAMGTVLPSRVVTLLPEVGGKIIYQNPKLIPGGIIDKGEQLVRIDPRDYNLMLKQQGAAVERAKMELDTERARKSVAEKEWALIGEEVQLTDEGRKLALRETQLKTAEAGLASAKSGLEQARLARNRTTIRAPFSGTITEEFVDKGQIVGPASRIATMVSNDVFWVRVSVPVDQLAWITIPGIGGATTGSAVHIKQNVGDSMSVNREGRVLRLLGDLDARGKMARLLVEVDDPFGLNMDENKKGLPLLLGAQVSVIIDGPQVEEVLMIPRRAVHDKNQVWLKRDGKLAIETVDIVWSERDAVFVRATIAEHEELVLSHIAAPVEGMGIRTESEAPAIASTDAGTAPRDGASSAGNTPAEAEK